MKVGFLVKLYNDISSANYVTREHRNEFRILFQNIAFKYFYNFKPYKIFSAIFSRNDVCELKKLGKNKNIVVCKPDKGRGVVILNRSSYIDKMKELISDTSKFTKINESIHSYSLKIEDKVNNFLRKLKNLSLITDDVYKKLHVTGTGPGILYGLPKIHKPNFAQNFQFRPIFAAYNTASYKLSKFLVPILAPFTTSEYTTLNSYAFVDKLSNIPNNGKYYMASFDVESLFTNIPLQETIDIILKYLFTSDNNTVIGLSQKYFRELLQHSVLNSFFIFDNVLYKQTEGLGMGLPLGPTFANIFMCYHESKWLNDCPVDFRPVFYQRYIDDTFLLFNDKHHASLFLNYLNCKHQNIKFTMEAEANNELPFLDVKISRNGDSLETSVYRKPTFTGLGLSYFSFCLFRFKVNAIKTLLSRAYCISSNYLSLHTEFEYLKRFFSANGYPAHLVESIIKKLLNNKLGSAPQQISTENINTHYVSLPYFGCKSEQMMDELLRLFKKYCPSVTFRIVLVNNYKMSSLFKFKDVLPCMSRSSIVYTFTCAVCGTQYTGSTCRTFNIRVSEHAGKSHRTGRPLAVPPHSAIRAHTENTCGAPVRHEHFKIVDSASDPVSLRILESLYIFKHRPQLNDTASAYPLNVVN